MHFKTVVAGFAIFSINLSTAWSFDFNGTVTNQAGKSINKAVVTLVGKNLKDTTDALGSFKLSDGTPTVERMMNTPRIAAVNFERGRVTFAITGTVPVRIDLFDLRGKLTEKILDRTVTAGNYRFDISAQLPAVKMLVVRVSVGDQTVSFRYMPLDRGKNGVGGGSSELSIQKRLAIVAAVVDTLKVSASGYMPAVVPVSSYTAPVTVKLDTMSLARFSFFLTSLAGLQALSGKEIGFGGDFRFGKTGQGAGLLGADSICQCLAERSMPGSKVKQWRAFLSVVKGPDGKQVNAIDRIGTGPWYDRLGRLFGNNLSELTSGDRPANADAAIKNDLPNEDGVPNHTPDPNKAKVDNHMTVTGSDNKGVLYYGSLGTLGAGGTTTGGSGNATCDDWTSTTSSFKARCGLSWPQAMTGGMKNWISQMNTAGCEAGTDLTDQSGPGTRGIYTIGNGGGYGGFYCFALNP